MKTAVLQRAPSPPFDWRIGLPVLVAIALQTAGALLWIGAAEQRLMHVERQGLGVSVLLERTARLEEQMTNHRIALDRIEMKLERLLDTRPSDQAADGEAK